jgi:RimJ/RimL family protein N-acetyltransferase
MSFAVRRLTPDDAEAYRALRLEALQAHPEAYGTAYEEQQHLGAEHFGQRLNDSVFFGAFGGAELVGSVGLDIETARKSAHMAKLIGVYLRKEFRGQGRARALLEAALDFAATRVLQVHLGVGTTNLPARRLYESLGFEIYGTEPRALCVNGKYIDEHLMVRFFDKAPERDDK